MDLIFLNGAMGAGKTATARALQKKLPPCAMADGDDLWNMYPFAVNDTTKAMVLSNIGHVLNSYLQSGLFSSTIFSWVMHEESIVQDILLRLPPPYGYRFFCSRWNARIKRGGRGWKRTPRRAFGPADCSCAARSRAAKSAPNSAGRCYRSNFRPKAAPPKRRPNASAAS